MGITAKKICALYVHTPMNLNIIYLFAGEICMKRLFVNLICICLFLCSCSYNSTATPSTPSSTTSVVGLGKITATNDFIRACNLNAGGYMGNYNGTLFFTNYQSENRLYAYDTKTNNTYCVDDTPNDSTSMITVIDNGILFVRAKKLDMTVNSRLYQIKHKSELCKYDGKTISVLTAENVLSYTISDEYIFYSTADLKIYRMKLDGTEKTVINNSIEYAVDVQFSDGKLYIYNREKIGVADFNGKVEKWRDLYNLKLAVNNGAIYYINTDVTLQAKELKRLPSLDGKEETIADRVVENFCIYKGEEFICEGELTSFSINSHGETKIIGPGDAPLVLDDNYFASTSFDDNFKRQYISIYLNRELFSIIDDNQFNVINRNNKTSDNSTS